MKKMKVDITAKNSSTTVVHQTNNFIKALRLHKGWSQAELAKKLGITQPYVARLESYTDWTKIPLKVYHKLSIVTGADLTLPKFKFMES